MASLQGFMAVFAKDELWRRRKASWERVKHLPFSNEKLLCEQKKIAPVSLHAHLSVLCTSIHRIQHRRPSYLDAGLKQVTCVGPALSQKCHKACLHHTNRRWADAGSRVIPRKQQEFWGKVGGRHGVGGLGRASSLVGWGGWAGEGSQDPEVMPDPIPCPRLHNPNPGSGRVLVPVPTK